MVVPPGLVQQWDDERRKFTGNQLTCIKIQCVDDLKRCSVKQLCEADIIIVPAGIIEEAPKPGPRRPYTEHLVLKSGLALADGKGLIPPAPTCKLGTVGNVVADGKSQCVSVCLPSFLNKITASEKLRRSKAHGCAIWPAGPIFMLGTMAAKESEMPKHTTHIVIMRRLQRCVKRSLERVRRVYLWNISIGNASSSMNATRPL